ncbi:hypothetical protein JR316_0006736 [Psilocybe cubensis]|uniref:Uncharacterized protein n=2 Tax=Psilocybe cubensis TaxID=181762 RepID=A0ACB8GYQ2_PSICU|nr:hypothetical protein JR316_0006736 [Psilocybe cubensis]KAH9480139.1 hypothetical protein JR316_0006736 [Psilocybe cubensis]
MRTNSIDIQVLKLSPNGSLLAIGDESGLLDIKFRYPEGQGRGWESIRLYNTGGAVRAIVWHPMHPNILFSGSANGNIYRIEIKKDPKDDDICCGEVPAFIHHLSLSEDGEKLSICYGYSVAIVLDVFHDPKILGRIVPLDLPQFSETGRIVDCPVPRAAFYLNDNVLLVILLGSCGILAFSTSTGVLKWRISLAPNSMIGSCAISPSRERLAVKNLANGIDWYSTSHQRYVGTTLLENTHQFIVDIAFLDEETVAIGSQGSVLLATFGFNSPTGVFNTEDYYSKSVQTVACGIISKYPVILSVSPRRAGNTNGRNAIIHIARIEPQFSDHRPFVLEDSRQIQIPGSLSDPELLAPTGPASSTIWICIGILALGLAIAAQTSHDQDALISWLFHTPAACAPETTVSTSTITERMTETSSMTYTSTSILTASPTTTTISITETMEPVTEITTFTVTSFPRPESTIKPDHETACLCTMTGTIHNLQTTS